jgi:hypothetical protein
MHDLIIRLRVCVSYAEVVGVELQPIRAHPQRLKRVPTALRELTYLTFVVTVNTLCLFLFARRLCDSVAQEQDMQNIFVMTHSHHYAAGMPLNVYVKSYETLSK